MIAKKSSLEKSISWPSACFLNAYILGYDCSEDSHDDGNA